MDGVQTLGMESKLVALPSVNVALLTGACFDSLS